MKRLLSILLLIFFTVCAIKAQTDDSSVDGFTVTDNTFNPNRARDSLSASHKKAPKGFRVWTIDDRFGDIIEATPDTAHHLFINSIFTDGVYGEYNTTGNLGSPRISRIATDRDFSPRDAFLEPYGYFITKPSQLFFTNTLSPITDLYYNNCGDKTNGEDHLKVLFAVNAGKKLGLGFKFDYLYGRGYYQNQNGAYFDYTFWLSYLGDRYQSHFIISFDHMKNTENGGITDDEYITHPEALDDSYGTDEIPTVLESNWNKIDGFHATYSHRYNIGFHKKVPLTEEEKEAKRFALQSLKEQQKREGEEQQGEEGRPSMAEGRVTGRPKDAVIMGDLPAEDKKDDNRLAEEARLKALNDSLMAEQARAEKDTSWTKEVYVPVTSFIHNLNFDTNHRTYLAYLSPDGYYSNTYAAYNEKAYGDSINDITKVFAIRNRFAIALSEGLNKYIPMGAKVFVGHELRRYTLPALGTDLTTTYTENNISLGAQIIRSESNRLRYNATFETTMTGEDAGNILIDGDGILRMRLLGDTANVKLRAFYHLTNPTFNQRHYHSKHFWWDNDDLSKQMQTHIEGSFTINRTHTSLRVAYDNLQNYTYLASSYSRTSSGNVINYDVSVRQASSNISLFTIQLEQNLHAGVLKWENRVTFQHSTDEDVLPVPTLNYWTNLYLDFRIARVLKVHFGGEAYWFSSYYAPEYCSQLGQYTVQTNSDVRTKIGNYPFVNVYASFKLKQCRFFVMMSHVTAGNFNRNYFLTPHYPTNERVLRFGLAWTFDN